VAAEIKKSSWGGKRTGAGRPRKSEAKNAAYEAAEVVGTERTYIYLPTLNPVEEFTARTRTDILKKARWLYNNVGLAARAVDGIARYACGTGIIPQARSSSSPWNKATEQRFEDSVGREAFGFDAAGQFNFYTAQAAIIRHAAVDGDFFGQLVQSKDGRAMMRFFGSEKVGNAITGLQQEEWRDGVRVDEMGKPTQYRILTNYLGTKFQDVSSDDICHFYRPQRVGYTRAPSWLARAALHLHDMADIVRFTKTTFKLASQPAYIIKSPDAMQIGMGAALKRQDVGDGNKVTVDKLYAGSGVMQLPPGAELQQFRNEHPGQNFQQFLDFLARDISWGIGVSPELLWDGSKIGGANTRFVLADAQVFFSELQDWLINSFCRRFYKYWVWSEIRAGRLPMIDDWWKVEFITPARITVDYGRDTKAMLEIVRTGAMSGRRFSEMHGMDEEQEEDAAIASYLRRKEKCEAAGLALTDVFPPAPGSPAPIPSGSQSGIDASGDTSNDDDADEADGGSTPPDSTATDMMDVRFQHPITR
jgi:capsid protein